MWSAWMDTDIDTRPTCVLIRYRRKFILSDERSLILIRPVATSIFKSSRIKNIFLFFQICPYIHVEWKWTWTWMPECRCRCLARVMNNTEGREMMMSCGECEFLVNKNYCSCLALFDPSRRNWFRISRLVTIIAIGLSKPYANSESGAGLVLVWWMFIGC
jgi:hypothetical protein